jgi:hypothetical protein
VNRKPGADAAIDIRALFGRSIDYLSLYRPVRLLDRLQASPEN